MESCRVQNLGIACCGVRLSQNKRSGFQWVRVHSVQRMCSRTIRLTFHEEFLIPINSVNSFQRNCSSNSCQSAFHVTTGILQNVGSKLRSYSRSIIAPRRESGTLLSSAGPAGDKMKCLEEIILRLFLAFCLSIHRTHLRRKSPPMSNNADENEFIVPPDPDRGDRSTLQHRKDVLWLSDLRIEASHSLEANECICVKKKLGSVQGVPCDSIHGNQSSALRELEKVDPLSQFPFFDRCTNLRSVNKHVFPITFN